MQSSRDGGKTWRDTAASCQILGTPGETTILSASNPGSKKVKTTYYSYHLNEEITTADGYSSEKLKEILNMLM